MQSLYDYKKFGVLYVDDEEMSLKYFTRALQEEFRIFTAATAKEGYRIFEEHKDEIGVLITDQRMPGEKGVELLQRTRQLRPRTIRILTTAYSDIDAAIEAVNTGAIYKYVTKPWDIRELEVTIKRGLEFFLVQRERDYLMQEKLSTLHNIMIIDRAISLGILAAGLSRYVRNSLAAVRTFLDLAPGKLEEEKVDLDKLRNPNFWKEFYEHVQSQVHRISGLLTDLVVAPEKPAYPFQDQVQLPDVIAAATEKLKGSCEAKQMTIANQIPPKLPVLQADRAKLQRMFDLLLSSEIINLPAGSRISLNAREIAGEGGQDPEVQIEIRDDGPGLPQELLRSVFDPFFLRQDNQQEFGINLMTCYFIVYHHGGKMDARSQEGNGTSFTLTFPTRPQVPSPAEEEQALLAKMLINETLWEKLLAAH
jgi:two-component system probable response regulator PhcQ